MTSNGTCILDFQTMINSQLLKFPVYKCDKARKKSPCCFCQTNNQDSKSTKKDCSLLYYLKIFRVSDFIYTKTELRRLLLKHLRGEGFLIKDKIKEVVECYQKTLPNNKPIDSSYFSPMHQIFYCKCGWMLFIPTTLPCGHTICKQCADEHMICSFCGHTLETPSSPNLFLAEIIENWFPNEYVVTRHKQDANELYKSKDYKLSLNEINLALNLVKDDYYALNIRAKIYIEMKEYKLALKDSNRSCKINQEHGMSHFIRGMCLSHLRNVNGAIDAFQLCLELKPEDTALSNDVIKKLDEILSLPDISDQINDNEILDSGPYSNSEEAKNKEDVAKEIKADVKTFSMPIINSETSNQIMLEMNNNQNNSNVTNSDSIKSDNMQQENGLIRKEVGKPCSSKTINENLQIISASGTKIQKRPTKKIHGVPKHLIKEDDFECKLCYELLYKPITTLCGHVFCKNCLLRTLDHNPTCPVCRMSLSEFLKNQLKSVTILIEEILEVYFNVEFSKRKKKYQDRIERLSRVGVDEDVEIPIFVCSIAFPYVECPLHIFEPKYRLMIRECLESGSQKFGMCIPQTGGEQYSDVGTICKLKKVQHLPDGRYIISAIASQRFLVQEKLLIDSMSYAKVKYFEDQPEDLNHEQFLVTSRGIYDKLSNYVNSLNTAEQDCIFNALGILPEFEVDCQNFKHGIPWVWWGLAALPLNFPSKLVLLRSKCVSERVLSLERFLRFLTKMQTNGQPGTS